MTFTIINLVLIFNTSMSALEYDKKEKIVKNTKTIP